MAYTNEVLEGIQGVLEGLRGLNDTDKEEEDVRTFVLGAVNSMFAAQVQADAAIFNANLNRTVTNITEGEADVVMIASSVKKAGDFKSTQLEKQLDEGDKWGVGGGPMGSMDAKQIRNAAAEYVDGAKAIYDNMTDSVVSLSTKGEMFGWDGPHISTAVSNLETMKNRLANTKNSLLSLPRFAGIGVATDKDQDVIKDITSLIELIEYDIQSLKKK